MKYLVSIFNKVLLAYAVCDVGEHFCSHCPYSVFKIGDKTELCMNMADRDKKIIEDALEKIDTQEEKEYLNV